MTDVIVIGGGIMGLTISRELARTGRKTLLLEKGQPGDLVVGGNNFGCGSSRETAPRGLKYAGVGAVIAQSIARNFFRNAICIGLPVLICPGAGGIEGGDRLRVDPFAGRF